MKLCLLLGSTILQEVVVADCSAHVRRADSQWDESIAQTQVRAKCKQLLFEQVSMLWMRPVLPRGLFIAWKLVYIKQIVKKNGTVSSDFIDLN